MELLYHEIHPHETATDWVVLIHGAGGSIRTFRRQIEEMRLHFNLLAIDLRHHGKSRDMVTKPEDSLTWEFVAEDVVKVINHYQLPHLHLVGVSMGAIVVHRIQQQIPDLVQGVVLAGGIFRLSSKMAFLIGAARVMAKILPFKIFYWLFAVILLPRRNHKKSRKVFIREAHKFQRAEFDSWLALTKTVQEDLREIFESGFHAPTLIVMGDQDHVFLKPALDFQQKYPRVELEVVDDCGHVVNIERPQLFNELCISFVKEWSQLENALQIPNLQVSRVKAGK